MDSWMPVLFVGHGSPMNALGDNAFTQSLRALGKKLPRPEAVCCVSAHWETPGTQVLAHDVLEVIHDFYGFPEALNEFSYPAPGAPSWARATVKLLAGVQAIESADWGLDHGSWSVLTHLYPKADVPVFQVSLDQGQTLNGHYAIGKMLAPLRKQGVLILGSGNIVHNLGFYDLRVNAPAYDWAVDFDAEIKKALLARDIKTLSAPARIDPGLARLALPTPEHYLPLLYIAGASRSEDRLSFPFEGIQNASMSMRAVLFQ